MPTSWAAPGGVVAGGLGSANGFHGIPVVVHGTLRGWSPVQRFHRYVHLLVVLLGAVLFVKAPAA